MKEKIEIKYPKTLAYYWNDEINKLEVIPDTDSIVWIRTKSISKKVYNDNIINLNSEILNTTHKYNTFLKYLKSEAKKVSNYNYQDSDVSIVYKGELLECKQYTEEELERNRKNNEELVTWFKSLDKEEDE